MLKLTITSTTTHTVLFTHRGELEEFLDCRCSVTHPESMSLDAVPALEIAPLTLGEVLDGVEHTTEVSWPTLTLTRLR